VRERELRCPVCGHPVSPDDVYCPRCGYYLRRYELVLLQFDTSLDRELSKLKASTATAGTRKTSAGKLVALILLGILSIVFLYYILNVFTPARLLSTTGLAPYQVAFGQISTGVSQLPQAEKILKSLVELLNKSSGRKVTNVNLPIVHADAEAYCTKVSPYYYLLTLILKIRNMLPIKLNIKKLVVELEHDSYLIRKLVVSNIVIDPSKSYRVIINTKVRNYYRKVRVRLSFLISIYGMPCIYEQELTVPVS